ncbi:hypothetical protein H4582DRAFT_402673 [Lactarius indigo]|nr:hypothetical protein H4582DRAFT_402673 [Lactarius indigo]
MAAAGDDLGSLGQGSVRTLACSGIYAAAPDQTLARPGWWRFPNHSKAVRMTSKLMTLRCRTTWPGGRARLQLHNYTSNFEGMMWKEMVMIDEQALEARGVAAAPSRCA